MLESIISDARLALGHGRVAAPQDGTLQTQALPLPRAARAASVADPARAEHRRRIVAASLLVLCLLQAAVGLAWDIRWHATVGRDDFWTLPHVMIYSGVTLAGLVALGMVLATSARYWRGDPALDDTNTITLFGVFHAPLGFAIAGFGLATMLVAAPGDNYWHQLYGIDVALWAPFHLMGLVGGGIAGLGTVHALAAEVARARARGWLRPRLLGYSGLEWLTLFAVSGLLSGILTTVQPAAGQFPTMDLGPVRFLTYPPLLALAVGLLGVACVRLTGRPGAATALAGLYTARALALGLFVPWAIQIAVAQQGLEYRTPGLEPRFSVFQLAIAASFLVPALAIDVTALLARR